MPRDPLPVLLRLRAIGLDAAKRGLADRLSAEAAAAARADTITTLIAREAALQQGQAAQGRMIGAGAAWLMQQQASQREANALHQACAAATADARSVLAEAHAGTKAIEAAMAHRTEQRRQAAGQAEQRAVDEAAACCGRPDSLERVTGIEPA